MHAVARLALHPLIPNIQTSWVKMGPEGAAACLKAGANDLGGTLMNESISRAAGAQHGQEMPPEAMEALIRSLGRTPRQRTTLYRDAAARAHRRLVRRRSAVGTDQHPGAQIRTGRPERSGSGLSAAGTEAGRYHASSAFAISSHSWSSGAVEGVLPARLYQPPAFIASPSTRCR